MKFPALPLRPNRDNGAILPALLSGVLVLMIALQFALPVDDDIPADVRRVVPSQVGENAIGRVVPDPIILRSALFSPSRGGAGVSASGAAASGPLDGAVPVGMVRGRGFARAVLQQSDGSAVSVPMGGRYHGWTLIGLNAQSATFSREGERIVTAFTNGPNLPNSNGFQQRRTEEQ